MKPTALLALALLTAASTSAQSVLPFSASDKTVYGNNPAAGKYANIRGIRLYYEVYGTGKPLLLLHGNGGSIKDFKHQIPYFAKTHRVIAVDSRAQGKSVDTGDSLSYEMMADDFAALLTSLRVDSCRVIGWSDGGIDGLLLAMRHPEKVAKLAITGANLWPDTTALEPFLYRWIVRSNDSLGRLTPTPTVKAQKKLFELMAHNPHLSAADLKAVRCPTMVIGGDNDVIPPRHTLAIAEALPQAYLWILPNSGHSTLISHQEDFNRVVGDFFRKPFKKTKGFSQLD